MPSCAAVVHGAPWVALGAVAAAVAFRVAVKVKDPLLAALGLDAGGEDENELGNRIELSSLSVLTTAESVSLRRSAAQVIIDRSIRAGYVHGIVAACNCEKVPANPPVGCEDGEDLLPQLKGATALAMIAKVPEHHERLIAAGALAALMQCLRAAARRIGVHARAGGVSALHASVADDATDGPVFPDSVGGGTLPSGWEMRFAVDGKPYFVSHRTGESTWQRPGSAASLRQKTAEESARARPPTIDGGGDLPSGWSLRFDQNGRPLYVNARTRASTRVRPSEDMLRAYARWQAGRWTPTNVARVRSAKRVGGPWVVERLLKVVLVALHDLIVTSAFAKRRIVTKGAAEYLCAVLASSSNMDVLFWAANVSYQLCGSDDIRVRMASAGLVAPIGRLVRSPAGAANLQRVCLHCLVLLSSGDIDDALRALREMAAAGIVPSLLSCLRSDDPEIVYWALGLIHELAQRDVARDAIRDHPSSLSLLAHVLANGDSGVQRIVLRTLGFLGIRNDAFKRKILSASVLQRLAVCLASGDPECVHWAVVLTHDLAMLGETAAEVYLSTSSLLPALWQLASRIEGQSLRLLAETVGFLASADSLHGRLVEAGLLSAVRRFASCDDADLNFWSASLLLNLAMTSDTIKARIDDQGCVRALIDLAVKDTQSEEDEEPRRGGDGRRDTRAMAAKALVMVGLVCDSTNAAVKEEILRPLMVHIASVSAGTQLNRAEDISLLSVFARSDALKTVIAEDRPLVQCLGEMVACLSVRLGMPAMPLMQKDFVFGHGLASIRVLASLASHPPCAVHLVEANIPHVLSSFLFALCENPPAAPPAIVASDTEPADAPAPPSLSKTPPPPRTPRQADDDEVVTSAGSAVSLDSPSAEGAISQSALVELRQLTVTALANLSAFKVALCRQKPKPRSRAQSPVAPPRAGSEADVEKEGADSTAAAQPSEDHGEPVPASLEENADAQRSDTSHGAGVDLGLAPSALWSIAVRFGRANPAVGFHCASALACAGGCGVTALALMRSPADGDNAALGSLLFPGGIHDDDTHAGDARAAAPSLLPARRSSCPPPLRLPPSVHVPPASLAEAALLSASVGLQFVRMEISPFDRTPAMSVAPDGLTVRNDSWTFESARATLWVGGVVPEGERCEMPSTQAERPRDVAPLDAESAAEGTEGVIAGVSGDGDGAAPAPKKQLNGIGGRWYYEAVVMSDHIMQIGWASARCAYHPIRGIGVGDDDHSYAFDGFRCRAWHGTSMFDSQVKYGNQWRIGDVVSCLIDIDGGTISYWLNGMDLGVAFSGVDAATRWYPAVSLACMQQVQLNFGQSPFRCRLPYGYKPMVVLEMAAFMGDFAVLRSPPSTPSGGASARQAPPSPLVKTPPPVGRTPSRNSDRSIVSPMATPPLSPMQSVSFAPVTLRASPTPSSPPSLPASPARIPSLPSTPRPHSALRNEIFFADDEIVPAIPPESPRRPSSSMMAAHPLISAVEMADDIEGARSPAGGRASRMSTATDGGAGPTFVDDEVAQGSKLCYYMEARVLHWPADGSPARIGLAIPRPHMERDLPVVFLAIAYDAEVVAYVAVDHDEPQQPEGAVRPRPQRYATFSIGIVGTTEDVFGCGVDVEDGRVYFTVNGSMLATPIKCSVSLASDPAIVPLLSCPRADANFGNQEFAFQPANGAHYRDFAAARLSMQ